MALVPFALASQFDIENRYGTGTVLAWCDLENTGTATPQTCDNAINWATDEIFAHVGQCYSQSDLVTSDLALRWCVVIAAYFLSTTRGNPAPEALAMEYDRVIAQMNEVVDRWLTMPGLSTDC